MHDLEFLAFRLKFTSNCLQRMFEGLEKTLKFSHFITTSSHPTQSYISPGLSRLLSPSLMIRTQLITHSLNVALVSYLLTPNNEHKSRNFLRIVKHSCTNVTAAATFITNLPQCLTMCFNSRMESRARTPSTRNSNRNRSIIIQLWCEAVMNQLIQITINVREVKISPSFEKPKPSPSSRSPSSTNDDDDVIDAILLLFVFLMSSSKCRVVNTKILQHFFFLFCSLLVD